MTISRLDIPYYDYYVIVIRVRYPGQLTGTTFDQMAAELKAWQR
jgi:hypothetical protein